MDFRFSPETEAFRQEVRDFVRKEWKAPADYDAGGGLAGWRLNEEQEEARPDAERQRPSREFVKKLVAKGWYTMHWPVEHGGQAAPIEKQLAYREVMAYEEAPGSLGGGLVAPVLMVHGQEWQKKEFLPKIAAGDLEFSQGFSEPNAGSDLANLQTRAVRDGDDYVISGQKIWGNYRSKWIHIMVRTDPNAPKHRGITYLLAPLKDEKGNYLPGITVRRVFDALNRGRWDEMFMDGWRVPARNIIGEENRGWYMAMTTLSFERSNIAGPTTILRQFEHFLDFCREFKAAHGTSPLDSVVNRNRLAEWRVHIEAARMLSYRVGWMQSKGLIPQRESSMTKLWGDILFMGVYRTCAQILEEYGTLLPDNKIPLPLNNFLPARAWLSGVAAIAGGTDEIQRNIIAQRGLGLPR